MGKCRKNVSRFCAVADGNEMLRSRHVKIYDVRLANIYFFHPFEEWESSDATTTKLLNYITAH